MSKIQSKGTYTIIWCIAIYGVSVYFFSKKNNFLILVSCKQAMRHNTYTMNVNKICNLIHRSLKCNASN